MLDPAYADRICPGDNGVFQPTVVLNGQVVGTWKRVQKKSKVIISSTPFTHFSDGEFAATVTAAERFAPFLGLSCEYVRG